MKIHKTIKSTFCGILLMGSAAMHAQQDSQFTHYMYNTININPAYAGSRGVMSVFGLHREQWVGLDGAPKTNSFSINTPINNSKLGLGVSFINDQIGVMRDNTISVDVSYTIDLGDRDHKLSFGVKGSMNLLDVRYSDLNVYNPNDAMFSQDINNQFSPNVGAGIYYHTQKSYIGLSVPNFLETERYDDNVYATMQQRMHFYLTGGHVFDLNPNLKFKPAIMLKAVQGAPLQADISGNFLLNEKFTLGVAYRYDAAWSALAGFQITDGLMIGYSYDAETTKLAHYNSGSHEVFMRFELFNKFRRVNSPRFF
ncbi:type IX secretion system membrane protein PorP/SprF [Flavobacterium sp. HSC-61S13]|uniref:PorP/SprF family type IX secretion system membrane protein n=1 Tax=Flavobacterium sp. HSC-61S13 TaxID=2910963 RepID=UPI00209F17AC|nr:type IX secretion system membrane protein PorP/SprF [Flavobacterium sp. HSC-61S13]MCP1996377.1 type IX secretion system PorP/SprF family membrane protein [Flavobacterium sp. HSC-61S13]